MTSSRRNFLSNLLYGSGMLGLRSLATGLPLAFLANPRLAMGAGAACDPSQLAKARFLLLSTTNKGCPLNANAPGSYLDPTLTHSGDQGMKPEAFVLAGKTYTAAAPWNILSDRSRTNLAIVHHATGTAAHQDQGKVLALQGSITNGLTLAGLLCDNLAPCLNTLTNRPINMTDGDFHYNGGTAMPNLQPMAIKAALAPASDPLANLHKLRDQSLDKMYAYLKSSGTAQQISFLDAWAQSRTQAQSLGAQTLQSLNTIKDNSTGGTIAAAVALFTMRISPVIALTNYFGEDNHVDPNFGGEESQHISGFNNMNTIFSSIDAAGLTNNTVFALLNVFGRTFGAKNPSGRDHNNNHNVGLIAGPGVQTGVYGGVLGGSALPMDPETGLAISGTNPAGGGLASFGKTLAAACGVDRTTIDTSITSGAVVPGIFGT